MSIGHSSQVSRSFREADVFFIAISISLSIYLSIYLSPSFSLSISLYLSLSLALSLSLSLPLSLSIYLSISLYIYLSPLERQKKLLVWIVDPTPYPMLTPTRNFFPVRSGRTWAIRCWEPGTRIRHKFRRLRLQIFHKG